MAYFKSGSFGTGVSFPYSRTSAIMSEVNKCECHLLPETRTEQENAFLLKLPLPHK
jgi:hypothetical protein